MSSYHGGADVQQIPLQHATASAAVLKPALMVVRAQQIVLEAIMVILAVFSLLYHIDYDVTMTIAVPSLFVLLSLLSLALSITLLVHTASPKARQRSCRGPRPSCMNFNADFGWDVTAAVLWTCMIVGALLDFPSPTIILVMNVLIAEMFITSAVLSGLVRKRLRLRSAAVLNIVSIGDVETAVQPGRAVLQDGGKGSSGVQIGRMHVHALGIDQQHL